MTHSYTPGTKPRGLLGQQIFGWIFFALMLSGVVGMLFLSVVPTPLGLRVTQGLAVAGALYAAWELRKGGALARDAAAPARADKRDILKNRWLGPPLLVLALAAFAYMGVESGGLWLVNALFGQPASRQVTVTGISGPSRYSCRHLEIREVWFLPSRAFCIGHDLAEAQVVGRALHLHGRGSPLGLNVETFELGDPVDETG